tara:strand:+ start:828 stop:1001 length:174 start_codon:yes stop_codon:yes gene_type:complete
MFCDRKYTTKTPINGIIPVLYLIAVPGFITPNGYEANNNQNNVKITAMNKTAEAFLE